MVSYSTSRLDKGSSVNREADSNKSLVLDKRKFISKHSEVAKSFAARTHHQVPGQASGPGAETGVMMNDYGGWSSTAYPQS